MKHFRSAALTLTTVLAVASCLNTEEGTPDCIVDEIRTLRKTTPCKDPHVDMYTFQGKTVYVFEPGTCGEDLYVLVLASDCKFVGLMGGMKGNTAINGEEFSTAEFQMTVWKK